MKLSFNFLNRWETAIFKNPSNSYKPISAFVAKTVLYMAAALVLSVFVLRMFGTDIKFVETIAGVAIGGVFLYVGYKTYLLIKDFPTTGLKIGFAAYVLFLFLACTAIFLTLVSYVFMLVLAILLGLFIFKYVIGGGSKGKKRIRVHYADGTSEEMEEVGRGPCGDTDYKSPTSGRTHREP